MTTPVTHKGKDTIRKFGETTSIKGVGRALKATTRFLRILWLTAVITGASFALYQVFILLQRYLSYETVTKLTEVIQAPQFPDITLCKLNPLSEDLDDFISLDDYLYVIRKMTDDLGLDHIMEETDMEFITWEDIEHAKAQIWSPSGYFQNMVGNLHNKPNLSSKFLVECQFYDWKWRVLKLDCEIALDNVMLQPDYFLCPTLSVPDEHRNNVRGVAITVYLDDFNSAMANTYTPTLLQSKAKGIRMKVHDRHTLPLLREGVSLAPGQENTVRLRAVHRNLLPPPYGNCINKNYLEYANDHVQEENNQLKLYKYTQETCLEVQSQARIVKECHCVTPMYGFTEGQVKSIGKMCANLDPDGTLSDNDELKQWLLNENQTMETLSTSLVRDLVGNVTQAFYQIVCSFNYSKLDDSEHKCLPGCEQTNYKMEISQAPWPNIAYQLPFWLHVIANTSYAEHFGEYEQLYEHAENGWNSEQVFDRLKAMDLIQKNFLQINLMFEDNTVLVSEQAIALTWEGLFANLGGLLNLWIGISFMTVIELVELIYSLIRVFTGREDKEEKHSITKVIPVSK